MQPVNKVWTVAPYAGAAGLTTWKRLSDVPMVARVTLKVSALGAFLSNEKDLFLRIDGGPGEGHYEVGDSIPFTAIDVSTIEIRGYSGLRVTVKAEIF